MLDDGAGHGSAQRDRLHFEVCLWLSGLGDGAGHGSAQRDRLQFVVVGVKVGAAADSIGAFLSWVRWWWLAFISAIAAPKNLLRLGLDGVVVVGHHNNSVFANPATHVFVTHVMLFCV